MKKLKISLSALLLTLSLSSFANLTDKIGAPVNNSFKKEFKNAEIVNCELISNLTKLTFKMNDLILYAYYSNDGELLVVTRNILTTQLPINLLLGVKKDYKDLWVTDLFEVKANEDHAYFITLESASQKIVLRSVDNCSWELYKKMNKD
jgi:hypothetical protein